MPLLSLVDPDIQILSIDGGTSTVGLCFSTVEAGKMVILRTRLLDVSRDKRYSHLDERHSPLSLRLRTLREDLLNELDRLTYPLHAVVYENHFINPRRPTSVIPLARFMQVVDDVCIDRGLYINTVAPQQMKKAINVTGKLSKADKDKVYLAIKKKVIEGEIVLSEGVKLDEISEHEIDAIGLGYTQLKLDGLI